MNYTEGQINNLLNGIYDGFVDTTNLPEDLYLAIAEHLEKGIYEGYGKSLKGLKFGTPDEETLTQLRENVYIFSGAKTYQQVKEMSGLVADSKNFTDFRKSALQVYDQYNKDWLQTEYNTCKGQATQAAQWTRIEQDKHLFPYLEYIAIIDSRTSDICRPLDGLVLPVDHPMWNNYTPLNHFNCRCTLLQIDKYDDVKITPASKVDEIEAVISKDVPDEFKMNCGKDKYIFNPNEHPYFKVDKKDIPLAINNFHLPIPEVKQDVVPEVKVQETGVRRSHDVNILLEQIDKLIRDNTLNETDIKALKKYTGSDYADLNNMLREDVVLKHGMLKFSKDLSGALKKMPSYSGRTFRGISFQTTEKYQSFLKNISKDGIFVEKGYMSTTLNERVTSTFSGRNYKVRMTILGKNGRPVQKISDFQREEEVLFDKGTRFKVMSRVEKQEFGDTILELVLNEL